VKIGDLVEHREFGTGIIVTIDEPTPLLAYQVVVVQFEDDVIGGIPNTMLEILNEN
jgi:hypothetical protein